MPAKLKIESVDLDKLTLDPANARKHDEKNLEAIKGSLKRFGQQKPIVVDKDGVVIAGNGTLESARALGWTKIDVVRTKLTGADRTAYALSDNRTSELAAWDDDVLGKTLQALYEDDYDIADLGFDVGDFDFASGQDDTKPASEQDDGEKSELDEIPSEVEKTAQLGASYSVGDATLHCDDCLTTLKKLEPDSVDALVCDPPAGISFMGKDWDDDKGGAKQWINWMAEVMAECLRVLKPGAHGLVWAIPRTSHWTATALEESGFEIRDVVTHLFGSGFPKSLNISKAIDKAAGVERVANIPNPHFSDRKMLGTQHIKMGGLNAQPEFLSSPATPEAKQWDGWGTALKPASEHWVLVRKPLEEKTVAANVLKHGTGGINIDGCRIGLDQNANLSATHNCKTKQSGNTVTLNLPGHSQPEYNSQGRFPANLVLDETAAELLDEQSGERASGGGASRFFMVYKGLCGLEKTEVEDTFAGKKTASKKENLSTDISGSEKTALFQMGTISIIETATRSTMSFPILSVSTNTNIGICTIDFEKTIKKSMVSNIEGVSVASPTECLIYLKNGNQELFKATVSIAVENTLENGETNTANTITPTTESIGKGSRFFYVAKASKSDRGEVNTHPTVKPIKLMQYFVTMVTPPGGVVLDCFNGSGTTGLAALVDGFKYIGCEKQTEYADISLTRWQNYTGQKAKRQGKPVKSPKE